ncbi:MAG: DUF1853 family protein [Endozoicomonadaceae bacterium]|nr:DUF1853 family protein [Endozoicomonadaceae bacterium]
MSVNFTTEQVANALKWLLNSPVLLDDHHHPALITSPLNAAYQPDITEISRHTDDLLNKPSFKRNHLLGIYYETLWQFIFNYLRETQLIRCNHQVQSEKCTVGEFDLLYFCTIRKRFIHREMAVKFYLGLPDAISPREWLGPGLEDRLDLKLTRMLEQQCQLSQTSEGRDSLEMLGITNVVSEALLQGSLFYPFDKRCHTLEIASGNHLRGEWLPVSELNDYLEQRQISHIAHLSKHEWITHSINRRSIYPAHPRIQTRESLHPLVSLPAQHHGPVMLTGFKERAGQHDEVSRFFLVPNDWEAKAHLRIQQ